MLRSHPNVMKSALPLAALAAMSALARPAHARPADGECEDVWYYQPPVYVGVNPGDAILFPRPSQCPATDGVCSLFAAVGLSYTHVALAYDSSGALLAQSQWDMVPPPSTQSTGGGICSVAIEVEGKSTPGDLRVTGVFALDTGKREGQRLTHERAAVLATARERLGNPAVVSLADIRRLEDEGVIPKGVLAPETIVH